MNRSLTFFVCLMTVFSTCALAQSTQPASTSPVAYVYVSSSPTTSNYQINGYTAVPSGRLTPIAGSPFPGAVQWMAVNGKWLFGADDFMYLTSFSIASNGALQQVSTINASSYNPYNTGGPENVFLDHTGTTLYDGDLYAYGTGDNGYEAFTIDQSTGQLNFLQLSANGGVAVGTRLSFTGGNQYAYSSSCYEGYVSIFGYQRNSDGSLTPLNINPQVPTLNNGNYYCPNYAAADTTNHIAVSLTPTNFYTQVGPPQLAVYTQDSSGNLTTTSTSANMPVTQVKTITDFWMAPSGKLLAVAGTGGLQVFHFNGANPITRYTGLLTKDEIDQVFWDNHNHLYGVSRSAGKLYVFTVTQTKHYQAPGSPYTITSPQNLIVLPK